MNDVVQSMAVRNRRSPHDKVRVFCVFVAAKSPYLN